MKEFNRVKGALGEELAIEYLKKKKYKILERNYKNKIGEVDIIARDKRCVVFVEVKARSSNAFGLPCEAVDTRKQNKIRLVAMSYIKQKKLEEGNFRFDVLQVFDQEVSQIENAF